MAFSLDPTINAQWNALAGQTGDAVNAQRQALAQQNDAYQNNQNVQNLYNLNQGNASTFLKDASAGLAPLSQGQNPSTQTYTPDAFKTMTAFEQALSAGNNQPTLAGRQNSANALMQEFQGTGSNPLLGQYNVLSGGTILPYQNGVMTPGLAGTPATNTISADISGKPTGITNSTLQNFINSNPNLSASDIKNLATVLNTSSPENTTNWLKQMTALGPNMFSLMANSAASALNPDMKIASSRGANPLLENYMKSGTTTTSPSAILNSLSSGNSPNINKIGDVFTNTGPIENSGVGLDGYVHVTSSGKEYLINPRSNRIVNITPLSNQGSLNQPQGNDYTTIQSILGRGN